jgi:hypothetical protein
MLLGVRTTEMINWSMYDSSCQKVRGSFSSFGEEFLVEKEIGESRTF